MKTRSGRQNLWPLLAATVLALLLTFPGGGFAQGTPTAECVANETDGSCLPIAPNADRVDLAAPVFSDPTTITNPLFPIRELHSVVMLGRVDRLPFRTEVTLLPETKIIEWNGDAVQVLVSQYSAFLDGRIQEVAIDLYAQADDGSVWYFGEDVFNYEDGVVADTHGTWRAGMDGPAAMIMPGDPQVGDVYRPENIPGAVFEEVTVTAIDQTVAGPYGPVDGASVVTELHQDGTTEEKIFAPGYGEFLTGGDGELGALALAVPTDAMSGQPADGLMGLATRADAIFAAAEVGDWSAAAESLETMRTDWEAYPANDAPVLLGAEMGEALVSLVAAVDATQPAETRQATIDVARVGLDLQLGQRLPAEVDRDRMALRVDRLIVDAEADDTAAVSGDVTALESTWNRPGTDLEPDRPYP